MTPCAVAPPLSAPFFHAFTHSGAPYDWYFIRFVAGSHLGFSSASAVPMPGSFFASVLSDAACAVPAARPVRATLNTVITAAPTTWTRVPLDRLMVPPKIQNSMLARYLDRWKALRQRARPPNRRIQRRLAVRVSVQSVIRRRSSMPQLPLRRL